jgi:hypothetical protein
MKTSLENVFQITLSHTFIIFSPYLNLYTVSGSNIVARKPDNYAFKYLSMLLSTYIANNVMATWGNNSE